VPSEEEVKPILEEPEQKRQLRKVIEVVLKKRMQMLRRNYQKVFHQKLNRFIK
jgi:uncharacterized protein HemX